MSNSYLYIDNTGVVKLLNLRDHNEVPQNDATVTLVSLVDRSTGIDIAGVSLPLTLDYVASSNGDYGGLLPHNVQVSVGQILEAKVEALGSQGYRGSWTETVRVKKRVS